jgi:hypothetical protein
MPAQCLLGLEPGTGPFNSLDIAGAGRHHDGVLIAKTGPRGEVSLKPALWFLRHLKSEQVLDEVS